MKREANGGRTPEPAAAITHRLETALFEIQCAIDESGYHQDAVSGRVDAARSALGIAYMREALFFALSARQVIAGRD